MQTGWVGGVFIERDKATLLIAWSEEETPYPALKFEVVTDRNWDASSEIDAIEQLTDLAHLIAQKFPDLKSLAVAGFGPFVSLKPGEDDYGLIHPKYADDPLKEVNLHDLFMGAYPDKSGPIITIHTDANAFALGEAMARDLPNDHILISILVTEGVGGGIVTGRDIFESARHPEIGLLHVRFDSEDPIRPKSGGRFYERSISDMADNKALRRRFSKWEKKTNIDNDKVSDADILAHTDSKFWRMRAYYVAQACLAATVFFAPHKIVITTNFGRENALVRDTRAHLEDFWDTRKRENTPLLDYPELNAWDSYVTGMSGCPHPSLKDEPVTIALIGAAGMCLEAARATGSASVTSLRS